MEQVNNYNLATRYPAMHHSRYTSKQVSTKHKEITRRNMLNIEMYKDELIEADETRLFKSIENFRKSVGICKKENGIKTNVTQALKDLQEEK